MSLSRLFRFSVLRFILSEILSAFAEKRAAPVFDSLLSCYYINRATFELRNLLVECITLFGFDWDRRNALTALIHPRAKWVFGSVQRLIHVLQGVRCLELSDKLNVFRFDTVSLFLAHIVLSGRIKRSIVWLLISYLLTCSSLWSKILELLLLLTLTSHFVHLV